MSGETQTKERIAKIELDEGTIIHRTPEIEHERAIAIADLLEDNVFSPKDVQRGPYHLYLTIRDNRLVMQLSTFLGIEGKGDELLCHTLPLSPFRRVVRDYFLICESYFDAIKHGSVSKIEAIDMGRRGIHNEGSEQLQQVLADAIEIDFETARRLFTLLCVLHIK